MTASRDASPSSAARRGGLLPRGTGAVRHSHQVPVAGLLDAVTTALPGSPDLIPLIPVASGATAFLHAGDGLVGWGEHARFTCTGSDAAQQIGRWFDRVKSQLRVRDDVGLPGTGPIAVVSLGFDDNDESVAVVPAVVLGRRDGVSFSTVIGVPPLISPVPVSSPGQITYADGSLSVSDFTAAVSAAVQRIQDGQLQKVVLAHDLRASTERPIDERYLLTRLAAAYPSCWTYAVQGLVGASPEMLVRRKGRRVTSRVLAGTAWPESAGAQVSAALMGSSKDLAEHAFAVASVAAALTPSTRSLQVPDQPHPLVLANLTHLATDIRGELRDDAPDVLALAASLHPTAAVGGAPADLARLTIRELEPFRRGRYAAPVGWMDAAGDGEFAIALRCAEVIGQSVRMIAGCGIVAGSDPEIEAREAQVKMLPIREALEG